MLKYRFDIIRGLKDNGYSSYRIAQDKVFNQTTLQKMRNGEMVPWASFEKLCALFNCQPGDLLEYVPDASAAPPSGTE